MIPGEARPEEQARWREGRLSTINLLTSVGLTAILSFGYNVWCARQLGAAHYADFAAALGIVAILGYAMNPLALVTAQLASRYAAAGNIEWVATLYRAMQRRLGVAIFVAAVLLAPLASSVAAVFRFSSWNIVAIAGSMVAILLLLAVARTTLRSLQRFTAYTRGLVGESMLRLGVGIPLIWLAPTAPSALAGYILASAAVLIIHDRMLRRSWRGLSRVPRHSASWLDLAGPSWALLIAYAVAQNLDMLFVKAIFGRAEAGMYAAAVTVVRGLMVVLTMPLDALLLPRLGFLSTEPRRAALHVARLFILLWGPVVAILVAFPRLVVETVFGPDFSSAIPLLPWLAMAAMSLSCSYLAGQGLLFLHKRSFFFLLYAGLALELGLIIQAAGDVQAIACVVAIAHASIAGGMLFLWLRASRQPSRRP